MRYLSGIVCVWLFSATAVYSQTGASFYSSLEPDVLLKSLFSSSTVVKDKYGTKIAKWKPGPLDRWSLPANERGWCYTEIDTVIRFKDERGGQYAVVVFISTEKMDQDDGAPVVGAATFQRTAPGWMISAFEIGLSEGYTGGAALVKFGKDHFALELPGGDSGQGYLMNWSRYFDTQGFGKILSLVTHEDNEGAVGKEDKRYFSYNVNVKFIKSPSEYYTVELRSQGTKETESGEIISLNSNRTFSFDEFADLYVETKK